MADEAQQTEVGKWLLVNGAKDYAQKFYDQGYTDKADLLLMTDDAVKEIVADKRGLASKLLRLIAAERKAGAPKDPRLRRQYLLTYLREQRSILAGTPPKRRME